MANRIFFVVMIVTLPACVVAHYTHHEVATFVLACVAIIPLARYMGEATEVLAHKLGSGIGGLMNATFGNAAELILALAALRAGKEQVVKASLTGSILGNLLLILGLAMFLGGTKRRSQRFNPTAALAGVGMMFLALVSLGLPDMFHASQPNVSEDLMLRLSTGIAVVMIVVYGLGLIFQIKTHAHLYTDEAEVVEEAPWSTRFSLGVLVAATAATAVVAELLVHAIETASTQFGFTQTFVGVIVVATVGNAAEHSTAVMMAMKDRMNLAFNIAFESSKQIALFVAPVLVLVGLAIHRPMTLEFTHMEVMALAVAVGASTLAALDGESNWLEGVMLLAVYAILGVAFYFTP